ncbi:MAG: amino acid ABC transporter permease [Bifidobacteriaceae bacterium]|jgi:glutamate transport system permease protein|nr:amino acid ABC transporter permease [Bifidobacteriaceae bacterium]
MSAPVHTILFDAPGPKALRRIALFNAAGTVAGLALIGVVAWIFAIRGQFAPGKWLTLVQWDSWAYYFLPGLASTLEAAALAVIGSVVFGLVFGVGRLSQQRWIRWPSSIIVEFFRAVPVLLMMVFVYLYLGYGGFDQITDKGFAAVVVGLVLYNGSVVAELVRSGVHSLPRGQAEAAAATGLTRLQSLIHIEVPQALLAMLPALVAQLVVVLKDSALGYMVGYQELLSGAKRLGTTSGQGNTIQTLLAATILFLAINYGLSRLADYLGRRLRGRGARFTVAEAEELPPSVSTVLELAVTDAAAEPPSTDPAYYTRDPYPEPPESEPRDPVREMWVLPRRETEDDPDV